MLSGVVLLALSGGGCGEPERAAGSATATPTSVQLAEPLRRDVLRRLEVTGALLAREDVRLAARVAGRVSGVLADLGDRVPPGAVLLRLDATDWELAALERQAALDALLARLGQDGPPPANFDVTRVPEVQRARLAQEHEAARLRRAEGLRAQGAGLLSDQDFENVATAYALAVSEHELARQQAQALGAQARGLAAELALARQRLADTVLTAPPGLAPWAVAERLVSAGEEVEAGQVLFRLVDDAVLRFRFGVPEREAGRLVTGQTVNVQVESRPGESFVGRVTRIAPDVRRESGTLLVEAELSNADGRLRPGAFARGALATHTDTQVLFVPREAIASFAGVTRVFSVQDGRAVEHRVSTGLELDGAIEIVSGFAGDVPVVVSGAARLAQGLPVSVDAPVAGEAPLSER